jgi:hypothetical protein
VLWRQCNNERLADDNLAVQGGVADRRSHESDIEPAIEERRDLRGHRHRPGLDLNVLMLVVEGAEERRDIELIGPVTNANAQLPRIGGPIRLAITAA